jgi:ribosome-associated translation inhibitor RaiA
VARHRALSATESSTPYLAITGLGGERALGALVRRRMKAALVRLRVAPVSASVAFVDDDGPRGGPGMRCSLTVRVPHQPFERAEHTAGERRRAFDGAFAALERQLERYRERPREARRRPKKYYAARVLLEGSR